MHVPEWRKPIFKDYMVYDSTYNIQRQYGDTKKIHGCQTLGGREG